MSSLTRFNDENLNDCGKPIFTLIGDNGGVSNVFTHYERGQDPFVLKPELKKVDKIYIEGCIIRNPREITRQISQNCRLQKVSSTVTYQLQGSNVYTPEKVDEIERIFHSKTLTLNGIEIQFEGGQVFEALGEDFPNQFKLNVTISECLKWQIFGCGDEIPGQERQQESSVMTFAIPNRQSSDTYFNDNGLKVADDYEGLLNYYDSQEQVLSVTDIDTSDIQTNVPFAKIFKVEYFKETPDPFYYDKFSPSNKVFGLRLSSPDAYNELSRGMNSGSCSNVSVDSFEVITVDCSEISIQSVEITMMACEVVPILQWRALKGENLIRSADAESLLSISLFNPEMRLIEPETGLVSYVHDRDNETLCDIEMDGPIPDGAIVESILLNGTTELLDSHTFIISGGNIVTLTPCIYAQFDDTVVLSYRVGGEDNYIGPIGQISGMCTPETTISFTNSDDAKIPVGSTLTIYNTGLMTWEGKLTSYLPEYGAIELSNIKIN